MLPTFRADERIRLVAAADPRLESRAQFVKDFGGRTCASVDELCDDPEVEVIYIATPHQYHAEHCLAAARCGKHVLVEKPMAVTLADCAAMIDAARKANVRLVVGHSHSFDAPYLRTRALIESGAHGPVRMITALNFTDFLYRPRRPEELDTAQGGGAVFNQGAHQVDVVRLLGGGRVRSIRAQTGAWDARRPTEGAFSALLTFENAAFASLTYSGYAHFDSDELVGWIGEMGTAKSATTYGVTRAALRRARTPAEEVELKRRGVYGAAPASTAPPAGHQHFGVVIASCERADLRPLPTGVMIYGDERAWMDELPPPGVPRAEVIDELYDAIVAGQSPVHSGEWAMATLEVCRAILESARLGKELRLHHQIGVDMPVSRPSVT